MFHHSKRLWNISSSGDLKERLRKSVEYCVDRVKTLDHENYICTRLLPSSAQSAVCTLRAFNVEIATIRDQAKEPAAAAMRLEWWKNTLDMAYAFKPPEHPVATAMTAAIKQKRLTRRWLSRIITAREQNLNEPQSRDVDSFSQYAEQTSGSLLYLTLECLGVRNVQADHVASHIGKAQGIVTLLRSIPYHARLNLLVIPRSLVTHHNIDQSAFLQAGGCNTKELGDAVFGLASVAKDHLHHARRLLEQGGGIPSESLPAFLPAVPTDVYLERLRDVDFNVFHPSVAGGLQAVKGEPFLTYWRVWRAKMQGRF